MSLAGFQRRRRELAAKQAAEESTKEAVEIKPIDKMTVEELKQYAAENRIDLGATTKKADILAVIAAHKGA
jgi:3'-phosphoadenosine 5'-phosphosulfate sulfotransferase (PAPS reductase)/FAD synthetase